MAFFPLPSAVGAIKRVGGADPAAGAEVTDAVPAGKSWYLVAVSVSLVQGLTQTPWPSLVIDDGTNIVFQAFSGTAAMSVSTTTQHSWGIGVPAVGSGASTANTGPLGNGLVLGAGWRIRTSTTGIGANSNYGVPSYFVCELG